MDTARILVIDDEPAVTRLCRRVLGREGFDVHSDINGSLGLQKFKKVRPELVLLDVNLPDRDGLEVLAAIQDVDPESAVIVITGHGTIDVAIAALKSGAQDFLRKPFVPEELVASVRGALDRMRLHQENQRLQARLPILEISKALMSETSPARLTQLALATVQQELNAVQVSLMLLDEKGEELSISMALGLDDEVACSTRVAVGEGLAGQAAQNKKPILVSEEHMRHRNAAPWLSPHDTGSAIYMPLLLQNRVLGVLNASRTLGAPPFRQDDVDLLSILCGQIAVALENARLFERTEQEIAERERAQKALSGSTEALRRYTERLEILHEIEQGILAARSPQAIAQAAVSRMRRLVSCRQVGVALFDRAENSAVILAVDAAGGELRAGAHISLDRFENEIQVLRQGKTAIVERFQLYDISPGTPPVGEPPALVSVPLLFQGELIGSLNLTMDDPAVFTEEYEAIARQIVDQLAIAIQQARLSEAEVLRRQEAEALRDSAAALNSTLDLEKVLDRILDNVGRVVPHDAANIMFVENGIARVVRHRGYAERGIEETIQAERFTVADTPTLRQMAESGEPMAVPDPQGHPRWVHFARLPPVRSYAGAPIRSQGEVIGFLNLNSNTAGFFAPAHAERLQVFADQAAVAIENARLHEQVQRHVEHLEQRVADRTKELAALYEVTAVASKSLELEPTLTRSLEQALAAMDGDVGVIQLLDARTKAPNLTVQQGTSPDLIAQVGPILSASGLVNWVVAHDDPMVVPNVSEDARIPITYGPMDTAGTVGQRAYVGVPMRLRGETRGVLSIFGRKGQQFNVEDVALLASIADHVAVAVENAQLYEAERRRVEQFRLISEVGNRITSILAVDDLLQEIVRLVKKSLGYFRVGIGLIEGDEVVLGALSGHNLGAQPVLHRLKVGRQGIVGWVAQSGTPLLAPDTRQEPRFYDRPGSEILSELAVPLKVKEKVIGVLDVQSDRLDAFDESDLAVLQSLANQAAVAIENARLYEQAQQMAALEERERLARELHDSATQSLYSLSLFAEAGSDLIRTGQFENAGHYMARIGQIAQDALKEMRLMVHELRSPALEQEGLSGALRQRLEAVEKRLGIEACLLVEGQIALPVRWEEELYRIALEALNNALKHAEATTVTVHIRARDERVELAVTDNGRGFDLDAASSGGGMGLVSMRERAERMGSTLRILAAPGGGTQIAVAVNNQQGTIGEGEEQ